jgi:aryl-alcohol dehydrogenase-like predicted oxidoreductase
MTDLEQRTLGRTGRSVSVIGLGTWQLGADWGDVSEESARGVLEAAADAGVTFFDTADVYGDGRSEQILGRFLADRGGADDELTVATKMGRRMEQVPENYRSGHFRAWVDRSRRHLRTDRLHLVQLHCPPSEVIDADATYDALDALVEEGSIAAYGVSVETADQALSAIARPHVASIQIILNAFRLKPLEQVLPAAAEAGVGIIARVPLASGLLSGKYDATTTFAPDDHRTFNRDGSAFDVGETFSGVDYETGLEAAADFAGLVREHLPAGVTTAQAALAWVAQQPGVTTVIPGARDADQARANADAGRLDPLPAELLDGVRRIYDERLRASVHHRW